MYYDAEQRINKPEDASEKTKTQREKKKKKAMECRKQTRERGQVHGPEKKERISLSQNFIPSKSISLEYRRRLDRLKDIPK